MTTTTIKAYVTLTNGSDVVALTPGNAGNNGINFAAPNLAEDMLMVVQDPVAAARYVKGTLSTTSFQLQEAWSGATTQNAQVRIATSGAAVAGLTQAVRDHITTSSASMALLDQQSAAFAAKAALIDQATAAAASATSAASSASLSKQVAIDSATLAQNAAAVNTGGLMHALYAAVPVNGKCIVAIKSRSDCWLIRIALAGGQKHDFVEYELCDNGTYMGIAHAYGLRSIRAKISGAYVSFLEQSEDPANSSTVEFAMYCGLMSDPFDAAHYTYYGIGHGNLAYLGLAITLDGGGANLRDTTPVGTILRGNTLTFTSNYNALLFNGQTLGAVEIDHMFSASGCTVLHSHNVTASGIGVQNSYAHMLPFTGVNRIKPLGAAEIAVDPANAAQITIPVASTYAIYSSAAPTTLLELVLPWGHVGNPPSDDSYATTSKRFLVSYPTPVPARWKLYMNWCSGNAPMAIAGTHSHQARYSVRIGAAN